MIRASARSRWRPAGPSRAGRPSSLAMACTAAAWPCGADPVMVTALAAGTKPPAFEAGVDQVDDVAGQRGQVGDRLVLDLAAVAVGAAQVPRTIRFRYTDRICARMRCVKMRSSGSNARN